MSSVAATNATRAAIAGASGGSASGNTSIGKSDFLKLLVAQLRNQDPMKPMEDREFIAQMAQLNTLEQMMAMNSKLEDFIALQEVGQASGLLGKQVEAELGDGSTFSGVVSEVSIQYGKVLLTVDGKIIGMGNVVSIKPAPAESSGGGGSS